MKLDCLRDLPDDEKDGAIAFMKLMNDYDPESLDLAEPKDFCVRDREFIDRLKWLAGIDESIIGRVLLVRKKLLRITAGIETPIPLVQRDADTIAETAWKGFYDTGLNIHGLNFTDLDLSGGFIFGDYIGTNTIINGECNENNLLVKGRYAREGRQIKGRHHCKGIRVLGQMIENSLAPMDVVFSDPPKAKQTLRAGSPVTGPVKAGGEELEEEDFEIEVVQSARGKAKTPSAKLPGDAKLPHFTSGASAHSRPRVSKNPTGPAVKPGTKPPPKPVQSQQAKGKGRTSLVPKGRSLRPRSGSVKPKTDDIDGEWSKEKE
jgi:hypothetical protein